MGGEHCQVVEVASSPRDAVDAVAGVVASLAHLKLTGRQARAALSSLPGQGPGESAACPRRLRRAGSPSVQARQGLDLDLEPGPAAPDRGLHLGVWSERRSRTGPAPGQSPGSLPLTR